MNVLDDLYKLADFNINMRTILTSQIRIIQHHSCIIQINIFIIHMFHSNMIILTSSVQRIVIKLNHDFDLIWLWKLFLQTHSESFKLSFMHDAEEFQTLQESCISWFSTMHCKDSFRLILRFESFAQISLFTQAHSRKLFSWCKNSKICVRNQHRMSQYECHLTRR